MNEELRLSIVIPAYNAEKTIERCINSLLNWDFDSYEIIVINDGSTDATEKIVECLASTNNKIRNKVRLKNQANAGRSMARNAGVSLARGEWIMFVDSDDYVMSQALPAVAKALDFEGALVVFPYKYEGLSKVGKSSVADNELDSYEDLRVPCSWLREYAIFNSNYCMQIPENQQNFYHNATVWARLFRRSILLKIPVPDGSGPFLASVDFSEDCLVNIAYTVLAQHEEALLSTQLLYVYDLGHSDTMAHTRVNDILNLWDFRTAVDFYVSKNFLNQEERDAEIKKSVRMEFYRYRKLNKTDMPAACELWKKLAQDDDFSRFLSPSSTDRGFEKFHYFVISWFFKHGYIRAALQFERLYGRLAGVIKRLTSSEKNAQLAMKNGAKA